jgi:hypothetical protein
MTIADDSRLSPAKKPLPLPIVSRFNMRASLGEDGSIPGLELLSISAPGLDGIGIAYFCGLVQCNRSEASTPSTA